jgi:biopolymer transport protein ExbD/biopolymer transport protein TolR
VAVSHHKLHSIRMKLRGGKQRKKSNIQADINVTPLVDVVLVLLIIFMVVTPMIARGVPVDLPQTMHHSKKPDDGKDLIVSITKDKLVYISANKVQVKDIPKIVEEERRRHPEKTIYVKGDARTTYGAVREVMEAVHKANIDDVMLGTDDVKEKH